MESLQMGIFPCLATLFRVKPRQGPEKRGFAAVRPGSAWIACGGFPETFLLESYF